MTYEHCERMTNSTDFHPVRCLESAFLERPADCSATYSPGSSTEPGGDDSVSNGHDETIASPCCSEHRWEHTNGNDRCVDVHNDSLAVVHHPQSLVREKKLRPSRTERKICTFEKIHHHAFHIVGHGRVSTNIATVSNFHSWSIGWREILRGDVIRMVMELNVENIAQSGRNGGRLTLNATLDMKTEKKSRSFRRMSVSVPRLL